MRALFTFIAACGLACGISQAQTVDDIITKNIEARGGIENLKTLESLRQTGKLHVQSFEAGFLQENKRPHMVRQEVTIQGMSEVTAYDGKTGWRVSPFEGRKDPELLSTDDLKALIDDSDIEGQLVDYKEKGYKAELMGHDSMEGTDCYKIKLTLKDGDVRLYYLDTDTYLTLKVETQRMIRGAYQYHETIYGDYEKIGGIYFPTAMASNEKGSPNQMKVTIEKVEVNVPLANSLFTLPNSAAPKGEK